MKIWEHLEKLGPAGWIQGMYEQDGMNEAHCLSGWIKEFYGSTYAPVTSVPEYEKVMAALPTGTRYICSWNDQPERTFEEVLTLVKELDL